MSQPMDATSTPTTAASASPATAAEGPRIASGSGSGAVHTCAQCSTTSNAVTKRCGACKTVYYCSEACQVKHWNTHKPMCAATPGSASSSSLSSTPSPASAPAISSAGSKDTKHVETGASTAVLPPAVVEAQRAWQEECDRHHSTVKSLIATFTKAIEGLPNFGAAPNTSTAVTATAASDARSGDPSTRRLVATLRVNRARAHLKLNDESSAIHDINAATAADPTFWESYAVGCEISIRQQNADQSMKFANAGLVYASVSQAHAYHPCDSCVVNSCHACGCGSDER